MRKRITIAVAVLLLAGAASQTTAGAAFVESVVSPIQYQITEPLKTTRIFNARSGEWITEIWPARCTVFEDGSARCPSYFE